MRLDGQWLVCDDGVVRPVISGEIRAADGSWEKSEFLVDTGADRSGCFIRLLQRCTDRAHRRFSPYCKG